MLERELQGSSAIPEAMEWNEVNDSVWNEREEHQSRAG